jgi:hypothetical protein
VTVTYLDDADVTDRGFVHFLRRYAPALTGLGLDVEIVFVTATAGQEPLATKGFGR